MGRVLKNKVLFIFLSVMLAAFAMLTGFESMASQTSEVTGQDKKYRLELNISHVDDRTSDKEDIRANARQVKVFKLDESYRGKDYLEIAKRVHKLSMAEAEKEFGEGILSDKSLIYDEGRLLEQINKDKFDKEFTFEKIVIDGLGPGIYLIKETDESKEKFKEKLITSIEELGEDNTEDGLLIVNMKKTVKNPETSIRITKVDSIYKNVKLDKVEFEFFKKENGKNIPISLNGQNGSYFYNPNGDTSNIVTTWKGGTATIESLPEGEYLLVETKPAPGYPDLNNLGKEFNVELNKDNILENVRFPSLIKVDETEPDKVLEGAVFNLISEDGKPISFKKVGTGYVEDPDGDVNLVTDSKGFINIHKISDGKYYFKEVKAPKGYKDVAKESEVFTFKNSILYDNDGKELVIGIKNQPEEPKTPPENPTGGYKFIKTDDSKKAKRLAGAVFKVQKKENDKYIDVEKDGKIYTVKSGKNGEFAVDGLEYGDYVLRETKAPEGFTPETNPIKFKIDEVSKSQPAKAIVNKPSRIPPPPVEETPPTVTTNPPPTTTTTTYVPTDVPKIVRGPLVKTGDIKIVIMLALGLVSIIVGSILVKREEKAQRQRG